MSRYTNEPTTTAQIAYTMDTAMIPAYALIMRKAGARLFYELGGERLEVESHRDIDAIPAGHPFRLVVAADALEELVGWADLNSDDEDLVGNLLDVWVDVQQVVYGN